MPKNINSIPDINYIDDKSRATILQEMVAEYNAVSGAELSAASPHYAYLSAASLILQQFREYIVKIGKMNNLKYAYGEYLDNLAAMFGLKRYDENTNSVVPVTFVSLNPNILIAGGTLIESETGLQFRTAADVRIPNRLPYNATVDCYCTYFGTTGNDIKVNTKFTIPGNDTLIGYSVADAYGGRNIETDDDFRDRIFNNSNTLIGTTEYYYGILKEFDPRISNIKITSKAPGVVNICFLYNSKLPTDSMIQRLTAYFNQDSSKKIITDYIVIERPVLYNYNINIEYYVSSDAQIARNIIRSQINGLVSEYVLDQAKLGKSINPDKLIYKVLSLNSISRCNAVGDFIYTVIADNRLPNAVNFTITDQGIDI